MIWCDPNNALWLADYQSHNLNKALWLVDYQIRSVHDPTDNFWNPWSMSHTDFIDALSLDIFHCSALFTIKIDLSSIDSVLATVLSVVNHDHFDIGWLIQSELPPTTFGCTVVRARPEKRRLNSFWRSCPLRCDKVGRGKNWPPGTNGDWTNLQKAALTAPSSCTNGPLFIRQYSQSPTKLID